MIDPRSILIKDYTYDLPFSKIAQFPLEKRDFSKLLICKNNNISETIFYQISEHIPEKSLLIFNDTKVIQARLLFKKQTGASIELFCLESYDFDGDQTQALLQKGICNWKCFVGNLKKWKNETLEKTISINENKITLQANKIKQEDDTIIVQFSWKPETLTFIEILDNIGIIPLPPYITRNTIENDKQRYQTIYANYEGSVAAPTAGLHFTKEVFETLSKKNIIKHNVTLHVGAGTFKPVSSPTINDHEMHAERISVNIEFIESILKNLNNNIICVGTTSLRTIESLYWFGVKLINEKMQYSEISIDQWEAYNTNTEIEISPKESLKAIISYLKQNNYKSLSGYTQLIILPSYRFRIANGIVTNFHQPQSTLLLLIAAFLGNTWREVYNYALNNNFRFLSYGDSCLFLKDK